MKPILCTLAVAAALAMIAGVMIGRSHAQSSSGASIMSSGGTYYSPTYDLCDTNDHTADEVRQCKLDYWKKKKESAQQRIF